MKVYIHHEIFSDKKGIKLLPYLINLCTYNNRHQIYVDYEKVCETKGYENIGNTEKEILKLAYISSVNSNFNAQVKVEILSDEESFDCEEAINFLNLPVSIILENSLHDSLFLHCIVEHFDESGLLKKHIDQRWIVFENAGGADGMANIIREKFKSFSSWPKKDKKIYLRCFVLMDSDKLYDKYPISNGKTKTLMFLERNLVIWHVLAKREMENYLPEQILKLERNEYLNEYVKLDNLQKDYFDIEKGFQHDRTDSKMNVQISEFYGDVSKESWKILKQGINTEKFTAKNFKSDFAKLFNHKDISKTMLIERCGGTKYENELNDIIKKIKSLI